MSTNNDIRHGMVDAELSPGELRRRVEERAGMEITPQYFSKTLAGEYHSTKAQHILREARKILKEINGGETLR